MRVARTRAGSVLSAVIAGALLCGLGGCASHRKATPKAVVLPPQLPVALETPALEANPPLVEAPKPAKLPAVPVAEAATKPKRVRRRPKIAAATPAPATTPAGAQGATAPATQASVANGAAAPPPVQMASNTAGQGSGETVIGALTPGGSDETPHARQDAQEILVSTDKRLNALPAQTQQAQRTQINQIRNFWKQAVEALQTGDAEGAKTLAVKAKLLLDDLEKSVQ